MIGRQIASAGVRTNTSNLWPSAFTHSSAPSMLLSRSCAGYIRSSADSPSRASTSTGGAISRSTRRSIVARLGTAQPCFCATVISRR